MKSTGKVKKINVDDTAGKTSVSMDNKAEIGSLNRESDISFSGDGKPDSITGKGGIEIKSIAILNVGDKVYSIRRLKFILTAKEMLLQFWFLKTE